MTKIMVFGTFDILHPGHLYVLKQARKYGDNLAAVVARDATVLKIKKHCPHNPEKIRVKNLKNTKLVDKVILGNLGDKLTVVKKIKPDIIILGYDQNNFVKELSEAFPKIKIVRLKSYYPKKYKSSLMVKYEKNSALDCHYQQA